HWKQRPQSQEQDNLTPSRMKTLINGIPHVIWIPFRCQMKMDRIMNLRILIYRLEPIHREIHRREDRLRIDRIQGRQREEDGWRGWEIYWERRWMNGRNGFWILIKMF